MKWTRTDLEKYVGAKEYIDTLIIPLLPFQLAEDTTLATTAFQSEVLSIFIRELEKELAGRIMLTPPYHYLKHSEKKDEVKRINSWVNEAKQQPFEHIFFISFDASWKKVEGDLDGSLLWLPGKKSGDIQTKEMIQEIRDQVEQVGELIRSFW